MKNSKLLGKVILTISSLFILLGCQQSSVVPATQVPVTPTTSSTETVKNIAIQNMAFDQKDLTITIGTKVKWTNNDSVPHTATSDNGVFASNNLTKGQSFEFTFNKEGTFPYHCAVHPSMKATITVIK